MDTSRRILFILFTAAACWACACTPSWGATASYTGTFTQDDEVKLISFSLASSADVVIRTYSYAGGTQADGNTVSPGGFDPVVAVFDGAGVFVNNNDDDKTGTVAVDPLSGEAFDALLHKILPAGSYTLALAQFDNFPSGPTVADGFRSGTGNFTGTVFQCSNGSFCDLDHNNRSNAWAVDVLTREVPEPSVYLLLSGCLAGLGLVGRLRRFR